MAINTSNHSPVPIPAGFQPLPEIERKTVATHVTAWAEKTPNAQAVFDGNVTLTYLQLEERSNQIANGLIDILGEGNHPVGVLINREVDAVPAMLGVLKAGKAIVGLDPSSPTSYLETIIEDLEMQIILTVEEYQLIGNEIADKGLYELDIRSSFDQYPITHNIKVSDKAIAVLNFTSGSTGKPKGVILSQAALWHRINSGVSSWWYTKTDINCLPFPIGFAWSMNTLFITLATGGCLALYDYSEKTSNDIAKWFYDNRITIAPIPSGLFRKLLTSITPGDFDRFPEMRIISVGGDYLGSEDLKIWREYFSDSCIMSHSLSSTEAGTMTRSFIDHSTKIDPGGIKFRVLAKDVELLILDKNKKIVPPGSLGEIAVRSPGIMSGYWNRPELNLEKFTQDPDNPGQQLLLTGDMGRLDEDGALEFAGREDFQIKVRGYLVNTSHVESALRRLPHILDAIVVPYQRKNGVTALAAYLILQPSRKLQVWEIKDHLKSVLPNYMHPQTMQVMEKFPRSPTGKVNIQELPPPSMSRPPLKVAYKPPTGEIHQRIAVIWQNIIEINQIGIHDNFFDLGGDSLSALEMILNIEEDFSIEVPQNFFENPTIAHLSSLINQDLSPGDTRNNEIQLAHVANKNSDTLGRHSPRFILNIYHLLKAMKNGFLIPLLVATHISKQPYLSAVEWSIRWSKNPLAVRLLYRREKAIFLRWLNDIGLTPNDPDALFQKSMVTNLTYLLRRFQGLRGELQNSTKEYQLVMDALRNSSSRYWRTLSELIQTTPVDELDHYFPITGMNYLEKAIEGGKGVILVSFHGMMTHLRFLSLTQRLGRDVTTISFRIPRGQSQFYTTSASDETTGNSMNAEIAFFGQKLLRNGEIVNVIVDSEDKLSPSYQTEIGNRIYEIKTGFADLAFNTGAPVIPHFGRSLPDGRPEMIFFPPLHLPNIDRAAFTDSLVNQFAAFLNQVWKEYPEAISWTKVAKHFNHIAHIDL